MPVKVSIVSGSIGSGKTSVLHAIDSLTCDCEEHIEVFTEDVLQWQFYLKKFYNQPEEYVFLFQKEVESYIHRTTKRLEMLDEQEEFTQVFIERSPLDVLHIFLKLNQDKMKLDDFQCLYHAMERYQERRVWKEAKYYLLQVEPELCKCRVQIRARDGEEHIDLNYLQRLDQLYNKLAEEQGWQIIHNGLDHSIMEVAKAVLFASQYS